MKQKQNVCVCVPMMSTVLRISCSLWHFSVNAVFASFAVLVWLQVILMHAS